MKPESKGLAGPIHGKGWFVDGVVLIAFAAFAAAYYFSRTAGADGFCELQTDGGNIASFAAAWDQPELFKHDPMLGDTVNFAYYATIHIPLTRGIARITGHYGDAFISMLGPHVFVYLLGYYVLGRVWLGSRLWALVFALINLVFIAQARGTYWGMFVDPLPRFTFAALLGFLLAAVLRFRSRPAVWPWIMGAAGLMMFVHPVSTPTIGLALWVGFCGLLPCTWSVRRRIAYLLFLGLVFLACAAPFTLYFFETHSGGPQLESDVVREIREHRMVGTPNPLVNLRDSVIHETMHGVLPMGLLGIAVLYKLGGAARASLRIPALWLTGIVLASGVLPVLLYSFDPFPGAQIIQIQFVRAFRYTNLIMYMFFLRAAVEFEKQVVFQRQGMTQMLGMRVVQVVLIGLFCWFGVMGLRGNDMSLVPLRVFYVLQGQRDLHKSSATWKAIEAVTEHTPKGARILPIDVDALAVRYAALRPVAFCHKDGFLWIGKGEESAVTWYQALKQHDAIARNPHGVGTPGKVVELAQLVDAEYVIMRRTKDCAVPWPRGAELVWGNNYFSLIRIASDRIGP